MILYLYVWDVTSCIFVIFMHKLTCTVYVSHLPQYHSVRQTVMLIIEAAPTIPRGSSDSFEGCCDRLSEKLSHQPNDDEEDDGTGNP